MGRPTKQGIDYFPLDTNFEGKVDLFIAEFEATGLGLLITLWQLIYNNEGYYINNNSDLPILLKKQTMISVESCINMINVMLKRDIFCKSMEKKHGILTSSGIQKRYFIAAKKKKKVTINENYILNGIDISENSVYVDGNATKEEEEEEEEEEEDTTLVNSGKKPPEDLPNEKSPGVPYKKIISLWDATMPNHISRIKDLTDTRKTHIKKRWHTNDKTCNLDFWEKYFKYITESKFLMGEKSKWVVFFDFVILPGNFAKIREGNYHK